MSPSLASVQYIAVAPAAWLGRLQQIVAKRGMRTLLISLEDVNDIYGAGLFGPAGLVGLTQRAQADYLLLGAGTTYDYKNFEGRSTDLGIPTGWIQVREGMAATDDIYSANFTTAVGRLPARSSNELLNMVNKIVEFEPSQRVVLLPDRDDSEGGVNRFSEAQASIQHLVLTVLIETETQDNAAIRRDLIAAIQSGARTVAFQGHAGFQEIGDGFVDVNNASSFPTSAWLLSTCLTGSYFVNTSAPTLARTLLNTPNAGGAMVIASTRFGNADYEHQMITKALEIMAADGGSWGQILQTLKRDLHHETMDLRRGIEPPDCRHQFRLRRRGGQRDQLRQESQRLRALDLVAHVNLAGRVVPDHDDSQARRDPARLELRRLHGRLVLYLAGHGHAVDDPGRHFTPLPIRRDRHPTR